MLKKLCFLNNTMTVCFETISYPFLHRSTPSEKKNQSIKNVEHCRWERNKDWKWMGVITLLFIFLDTSVFNSLCWISILESCTCCIDWLHNFCMHTIYGTYMYNLTWAVHTSQILEAKQSLPWLEFGWNTTKEVLENATQHAWMLGVLTSL